VSRLEVGRVAKAHGLRGEVAVVPISNRPGRFETGARLWAGERSLVVTASRPHQGGYLVRFAGIDDRNGAEALRGVVLAADAPGPPPEGELWVHELIGTEVRDRAGAALGRVVAVEANPAHDLLVLDGGALVPMVFVVETTDGVVTVELPDGLLDL
jgi:16S rRNA processing protein RimM